MISEYNFAFLLIMGVGSILFSIMVFLAYFTKPIEYKLKNKLYILFIIITFFLEVFEIVLALIYGLGHSLSILHLGIRLFWSVVCLWDAFLLFYCLYYYLGIDKNDYNKFRDLFKNKKFIIYLVLTIISLIISYVIPIGNVNFSNFNVASGIVPKYVIYIHLSAILIMVIYMIITRKEGSFDYFKMIIFNLLISFIFTLVQLLLPNIAVFTVANCVILAALYLFFENPDLYTIGEIEEAKEIVTKSKSSKTEVLVNISHDLKSPINSIVQLADEVMKSSEEDKDKILENIRLINVSSHNLMNTINNIANNSRLDGDNERLNESEYSLKSLLFDLSEIITAKVEQKPVKFIMNVDNSIPDMLYGDSVKVYQLLLNILSNAVKNTDVGKISLIITKEINESNILLKFKIVDSGNGIQESIANELKAELDNSSNSVIVDDENNNMGVGLKITKKYLDLMNGKIRFDSIYGAGATFFVEIPQTIVSIEPMGDINTSSSDITNKELADYSKYKILIVDDDYQSLQISSRLLSRYKFSIETSNSKKDCLYRIKNGEEYDIIFVEPMIANANDAEIIHIIKKIQELYKKSTVVALTSNNSSSAREAYFKEGIDAFVAKPINLSELDSTLNQLLSPKR